MTMTATDREALLSAWTGPSSDTEKQEQDRAEQLVRDAIERWPAFEGITPVIYTKGSYPNNTNVKSDSDVDVVVECHECIYFDHEDGIKADPSTSSTYEGPWKPEVWRREVGNALADFFDADQVDRSGRIAINVAAVPGSRPSADVVPSFVFHRYRDSHHRLQPAVGSWVWSTDSKQILNWPQQQLDNGQAKNSHSATAGRYKRFVRALKRVENRLVELGEIDALPSYFMECLVWNVENTTLKSGTTLAAGFRATLVELYNGLGEDGNASKWVEPNELKWVFGSDNKWTIADGRELVLAAWRFLDYRSA